jgi:hypothetical protein
MAEETPLQTTVRERLVAFLKGRQVRVDVAEKSQPRVKGAAPESTLVVKFALAGRPHEIVIYEDDVEVRIDGAIHAFDGADFDDEVEVAREVLKHLDREITQKPV